MIKIEEKKNCCGCMACAQKCPKNCIAMTVDEEGFLYPIVDIDTCVDCHLCEKVCPVQNQFNIKEPLQVYAAVNTDKDVLLNSSSGGIFSLLAERVIKEGGVVFGAAFNDEWEVCHTYTDSIEGIEKFRGSKYVQSRIGDSYKQAEHFLLEGRTVLFSGTPCQISGLKHYLMKPYNNLLSVDVVCHGTPSPGIWNEYIKTIPAKLVAGKNTVFESLKTMPVITGINFRDKKNGWQKFGFSAFISADRKEAKNSVSPPKCHCYHEYHQENLFMRGFLNNLYLRPSCYNCPARHGKSQSDILLGDFWGVLRKYPAFYNKDGVSLVLAYSEKGDAFFNSISCTKINATYRDALDCNINIEKDEIKPKNRTRFFKAYLKHGIKAIDKYSRQLEPSRLSLFYKHVIIWIKYHLNK